MIPIKVQCLCGQKYAFDTEPINGRMPHSVSCPVCGVDGTSAANEIIAQSLAAQTPPSSALSVNQAATSSVASMVAPIPTNSQKVPATKFKTALWIYAGGALLAAVIVGFVWWKHESAKRPSAKNNVPPSAQTVPPAQPAASSSIPLEYRYKNQNVTLPPEIAAFISAKEQQAEGFARKQNLKLAPEIKKYFTTIKAGHIGQSQQLFKNISEQAGLTNVTGQLKGPIWQVVIDAQLVVEAIGNSDPDLVLATAREMTNSLTPGCIYFGGTDPGRGLPTMLCSAPGEPFFVISQNPLADNRYLELLRDEYGSRIQLPTTNEIQKCFDDYTADAQNRLAKHQLEPGEDVRMENGKLKYEGFVSVMKINGLITKTIFDKNPDREFYVEESFPLGWMYPYLSAHGLLMKLNRQPLEEMPIEEILRDEAFWSKEMAGKIGDWLAKDTPVSNVCAFAEKVFANKDLSDFKGDAKFILDDQAKKPLSKLRSSIAGVYDWRFIHSRNNSEKQRMLETAGFAYKQAFACSPDLPEAVFRYVNLLLNTGKVDDAISIASTYFKINPNNGQAEGLLRQLRGMKAQGASTVGKAGN